MPREIQDKPDMGTPKLKSVIDCLRLAGLSLLGLILLCFIVVCAGMLALILIGGSYLLALAGIVIAILFVLVLVALSAASAIKCIVHPSNRSRIIGLASGLCTLVGILAGLMSATVTFRSIFGTDSPGRPTARQAVTAIGMAALCGAACQVGVLIDHHRWALKSR